MAVYFLDSSAIVKRYVSETGTAWILSLTDPVVGNHLHNARITGVEVVSAITRRMHGGSLSTADAATALSDFRYDFSRAYRIVDITASLIGQAMQLAETHALRGYDAVQLAAALDVQSSWLALGMAGLTLGCADTALNAAAIAEGLSVDDPNAHP